MKSNFFCYFPWATDLNITAPANSFFLVASVRSPTTAHLRVKILKMCRKFCSGFYKGIKNTKQKINVLRPHWRNEILFTLAGSLCEEHWLLIFRILSFSKVKKNEISSQGFFFQKFSLPQKLLNWNNGRFHGPWSSQRQSASVEVNWKFMLSIY